MRSCIGTRRKPVSAHSCTTSHGLLRLRRAATAERQSSMQAQKVVAAVDSTEPGNLHMLSATFCSNCKFSRPTYWLRMYPKTRSRSNGASNNPMDTGPAGSTWACGCVPPLTTSAFQQPGQSRYAGHRRSTTAWPSAGRCSFRTRRETALWVRQSHHTICLACSCASAASRTRQLP